MIVITLTFFVANATKISIKTTDLNNLSICENKIIIPFVILTSKIKLVIASIGGIV